MRVWIARGSEDTFLASKNGAAVRGLRCASNVADYCPNTFFTSPTLRCILPPAFSAAPRSRKFGFPMALPVSSFAFPFASLIPPWILSFVLDFINKESEATRTAAVACDRRLPPRPGLPRGVPNEIHKGGFYMTADSRPCRASTTTTIVSSNCA